MVGRPRRRQRRQRPPAGPFTCCISANDHRAPAWTPPPPALPSAPPCGI